MFCLSGLQCFAVFSRFLFEVAMFLNSFVLVLADYPKTHITLRPTNTAVGAYLNHPPASVCTLVKANFNSLRCEKPFFPGKAAGGTPVLYKTSAFGDLRISQNQAFWRMKIENL